MKRGDAEAILRPAAGERGASARPADLMPRTASVSLALEKAVDRVGFTAFPGPTGPAFRHGPGRRARRAGARSCGALADGKDDLAAAAVAALGQVTDRPRSRLRPPPSPGRGPLGSRPARPVRRREGPGGARADSAVPRLEPGRPHPGPVREHRGATRAVVIDGNPNRGGQLAGLLKALGYEPSPGDLRGTGIPSRGRHCRRRADRSSATHLIHGDWDLTDTLTNLKRDARTANLRSTSSARSGWTRSVRHAVELPGSQVPGSARSAQPSWRGSSVAGRRNSPRPNVPAMLTRRPCCWPGSPRDPGAPSRADLSLAEPALTDGALNQPRPARPPPRPSATCPMRTPSRAWPTSCSTRRGPPTLRQSSAAQLVTEHPAVRPARFGRPGSSARRRDPAETDAQFRGALGTVVAACGQVADTSTMRADMASPPGPPEPRSHDPGDLRRIPTLSISRGQASTLSLSIVTASDWHLATLARHPVILNN